MDNGTKFGQTFAILLENGEIKACRQRGHYRWMEFGKGKRLSRVRYDVAGNYSVETHFTGESRALDGVHLWWAMEVIKHNASPVRRHKNLSHEGLALFSDALRARCETLKQLLDASSAAIYRAVFATKGEALAAHSDALKVVRAHMRTLDKERLGEPSQALLVQLSYWCEQGWGRQTVTATAVGVSPQRVNDWLSGRKKMTGDQALRLQAFLARRCRK